MCNCYKNFEVRLARERDYKDFKQVLNHGRYPAFIGKNMMMRNASQGGALFYLFEGKKVSVSLINPRLGILLALNVVPSHQGHGLGAAIVRFLIPNFVRAIEAKVEWFEKLGYKRIGKMKKGVSLNTQVLVRAALFDMVGNLQKAWGTEESPVVGEESPALDAKEICHTAPNSGRDAMPLDIFEGVQ